MVPAVLLVVKILASVREAGLEGQRSGLDEEPLLFVHSDSSTSVRILVLTFLPSMLLSYTH